ncbi:AraC family transcriptional regulator [Labrenzia sp. OB1]|uniref:AraC family transcriptional regulator n=1 Tax=Labrenzia sp. OB1 TaxID=1561204 RepID=UPI0007B28B1D|nr:AraC family transcriptional regulator [Labrenzia sp. OB1]KZM48831.1 AraC family transcriptional regulator [Labrenzia sp. OB1]
MYSRHAEFLTSHPLLRTSDLDEARHVVTEKFCAHKLMMSRGHDSLAVTHNHVSGVNVSVNYLHYGADVQIDPGMLEGFYLLQVPLSGSAFVRHRGDEIEASATTATLLNPDRETQMSWHGDCRKLLLQIDRTYLNAVAEDLLGAPPAGPIRFDPAVDLTRGSGRLIRDMVVRTAELAEKAALFSGRDRAQDLWAETDLVSVLLNHHASNISHMLAAADHGALPSGIRRALAYIQANLSEPVRIADIARNADMNVRTLQKGFQRAFGLSPMQVLRNTRLDAARYQLSVRRDPPSVTDVAFTNGFSHLGRFSRDYKNRFGHLPSQVH